MAVTLGETPERVTSRLSFASVASLLFLLPIVWRLIGLFFEPPFHGHIWAAAGMAFSIWAMLLIPGGILAVVGLCLRPTRFGAAVLASWIAAPVVTTLSILIHG